MVTCKCHCEGDSPKQSRRFGLLRCRSQWQLSYCVHYMYLIEIFLKLSYALVHVFLYPFRYLTLPVDTDELDQHRVSGAWFVFSVGDILFLPGRYQTEHHHKLVCGHVKRFVFGRKFWDKLRFFCRHGLFRLVNQRDIVSGAFSYSGAGHIHLFMHLQHTVRGACYTFVSFARSFCNHLDNFYLLVIYGYDCSRAVLDIQ